MEAVLASLAEVVDGAGDGTGEGSALLDEGSLEVGLDMVDIGDQCKGLRTE